MSKSGLSASTIRHYLREGLLPPPTRPTPNSAIYDQRHLSGLDAINRIRVADTDLSLASVKRVLELVASGVEPEVAVSLRLAVINGPTDHDVSRILLASELVEETGITENELERFIAGGLVVPLDTEDGPRFDATDVWVVQAALSMARKHPKGLTTVYRVAGLIREASALEMDLRNQMVPSDAPTAVAAETSRRMQEWANGWHRYLFTRHRLREIREFGLGPGQP